MKSKILNWPFKLDHEVEQILEIPKGSQVLSATLDSKHGEGLLWVVVPEGVSAPVSKAKCVVYRAGVLFERLDGNMGAYVGTLKSVEGTYHIFVSPVYED